MKKILILIGTRPEAIKLAPLIKAFQKEKSVFELLICTSGQHTTMVKEVLDVFEITADVALNVMKRGQSLSRLSARLLKQLEKEVEAFKPDYLFVQGDTQTAFIGALVGFNCGTKICHIEAGLRSFNPRDPFPEEMNRKLIGQLADLHFAPTAAAKQNLVKEGIQEKIIFITGNTGIDALQIAIKKIKKTDSIDIINLKKQLPISSAKIILCTIHRRENQGQKLKEICEALNSISQQENVFLVFPVHPNPQIKKTVKKLLSKSNNILIVSQLNYNLFIWLMQECKLIITDSGGIQEEATSIGKSVVLVRETSERKEAITAGVVHQVGTKKQDIINKTIDLLKTDEKIKSQAIFGAGDASDKIIHIMKSLPSI